METSRVNTWIEQFLQNTERSYEIDIEPSITGMETKERNYVDNENKIMKNFWRALGPTAANEIMKKEFGKKVSEKEVLRNIIVFTAYYTSSCSFYHRREWNRDFFGWNSNKTKKREQLWKKLCELVEYCQYIKTTPA